MWSIAIGPLRAGFGDDVFNRTLEELAGVSLSDALRQRRANRAHIRPDVFGRAAYGVFNNILRRLVEARIDLALDEIRERWRQFDF